MTFIWFIIALALFLQNSWLKKVIKKMDKGMDEIEEYMNEQDMERVSRIDIAKLEDKLIDMEGKYNYYKTKSENLEKKLEMYKEV